MAPRSHSSESWLQWTIVLYAIALSLDLLIIASNHHHLRWMSKPFVMMVLIASLFIGRKYINQSHYFSWMAALVFSWLGDVFLMFNESFFIPGLVAFLIAHLAYLFLFSKIKPSEALMKKSFGMAIFLTIIFFVSFYRIILTETGGLFIPVLIYAVVIITMWLVAAHRSLRNPRSNYWLISGALLFVVSDSLLGYNKFVQSLPILHILIMLTYGLAQLSLFKGILKSG